MIVAVVGPTASGKSDLALDLAERLGGEIVGADAFQLYRGMDIGTAKVPPRERRGIPHHQLDVLDIHDAARLAAYQRHARADLDAVLGRGAVPILVGGSGLYVRAALDRLDIPPTDPAVRARLQVELAEAGLAALRARLAARDPAAAAAIEPRNARRVVRALEVIELTGRVFSATMPDRQFRRRTVLVGLAPDRGDLDARILHRVEVMWREGLPGEVARLEEAGLSRTPTATRAVGYAQALDELAGRCARAEAIAATAAATRRLARRQESWFRPDPRIQWLAAGTGVPRGALRDAALGRLAEAGVPGAGILGR